MPETALYLSQADQKDKLIEIAKELRSENPGDPVNGPWFSKIMKCHECGELGRALSFVERDGLIRHKKSNGDICPIGILYEVPIMYRRWQEEYRSGDVVGRFYA